MNCQVCKHMTYYDSKPFGDCEYRNHPRFERGKGWRKKDCEYREEINAAELVAVEPIRLKAMALKVEEMDRPPDLSRQVAIIIGVEGQ